MGQQMIYIAGIARYQDKDTVVGEGKAMYHYSTDSWGFRSAEVRFWSSPYQDDWRMATIIDALPFVSYNNHRHGKRYGSGSIYTIRQKTLLMHSGGQTLL